MMRAVVGLLFCVLTACGAVDLKTIMQHDQTSSRVAMLSQMASEIKMQVDEGVKSGVTPQVQQTITLMIQLIDDEILKAITREHKAAENDYNEKLNALKKANDDLNAAKGQAADAGQADFECVTKEAKWCEDYHDCQDEKFLLCDCKREDCPKSEPNECDDPVNYKWMASQFYYEAHQCDFGKATCEDMEHLDHLVTVDDGILAGKAAEFRTESEECNEAIRKCWEKIVECEGEYEYWEGQRKDCINENQWPAKRDSWCDLWHAKCDREQHFLELKYHTEKASVDENGVEIDTTGEITSGYLVSNAGYLGQSEADRAKEWAAVIKIKCLLTSYTDLPPGFDAASETECNAKTEFQYSTDHVFEYSQTTVDDEVAENECDDADWTITFHNHHWVQEEIGSGEMPEECSHYTKENWEERKVGKFCAEWTPKVNGNLKGVNDVEVPNLNPITNDHINYDE